LRAIEKSTGGGAKHLLVLRQHAVSLEVISLSLSEDAVTVYFSGVVVWWCGGDRELGARKNHNTSSLRRTPADHVHAAVLYVTRAGISRSWYISCNASNIKSENFEECCSSWVSSSSL
jgi:hypothetical protein